MESFQLLVLLLAVIFVGFPIIVLTFYVVRRLHELHRLTHPSGRLYISKDKEVYLELDDEGIFEKSPRTVVFEVRPLRGRGE